MSIFLNLTGPFQTGTTVGAVRFPLHPFSLNPEDHPESPTLTALNTPSKRAPLSERSPNLTQQ